MPTYVYECGECGEFEIEQRITEPALTVCACGEPVRRLICGVGIIIPAYMKAPGSTGSSSDTCDKQAIYLQSEQHRKDREQAERIYDRTTGAEDGVRSYLRRKLGDPEYVKKRAREIEAKKRETAA